MGLHRDPGIKRMVGVIDTLQRLRHLSRLAVFFLVAGATGAIVLAQAVEVGRLLLGGSAGAAVSPLVTGVFALAVCGLCTVVLWAHLRRSPQSISHYIPGDPDFVPDPAVTPAEWAAIDAGASPAFLRDLYQRPAARYAIADAAGQGPADSFEAFESQAASLRGKGIP